MASPQIELCFLIVEIFQAQGASTQVRFQPRSGQFLAAASENVVSIVDVESDRRVHLLKVKPKTISLTLV